MKLLQAFGLLLIFLCDRQAIGQSANIIIKGNVTDSITKETLPAVSIVIAGTPGGIYTDDRGHFTIVTSQKLPLTLQITYVQYEPKEVQVTDATKIYTITLKQTPAMGEVIVSAPSRTPQRIMLSQTTIESLSSKDILKQAVANYFDNLNKLKGVDVVNSGLFFATPTTRGFSGSGNARLNQFVDGMDNLAPGLNFPVGNTVGLTEPDVDNMELLPGASSVLYGSGGMNGTLLINSKNPFKYQGFSMQVKQGVNHISDSYKSTSTYFAAPYFDIAGRYAKQFNNKFAFKITAQYIKAEDWQANDRRNYNRITRKVDSTNRSNNPNYDGVNTYGDETNFTFTPTGVGQQPVTVSRTGYTEDQTVDHNTFNVKGNAGLFYKINPSTEISFQSYLGRATTVYTGSDRYSLRGFTIMQHKLEVKGRNWFARAWTTQEDAGNTYTSAIMRMLNEAQRPTGSATTPNTWAWDYNDAYNKAVTANPSDIQAAHAAARSFADRNRLQPGDALFQKIFDSLANRPISKGGAKFFDKSDLYMIEGQYKFDSIKFVDILVGASAKRYVLNSQGTLFADFDGRININEYGGFAQVQKSFFQNRLRLSASGRYDKSTNFKGRFTPRVTALISVAKDHNFRLSYQQAYRFPTTQNQWINLPTSQAIVLGGLPKLREYYNMNNNPVYTVQNVMAYAAEFKRIFDSLIKVPISPAMAYPIAAGVAARTLMPYQFGEYKAETMDSYEIGYKGLFLKKKLLIDGYVFRSNYHNFLGRIAVMQSKLPLTTPNRETGLLSNANRQVYSISVNATEVVKVAGWGLSADYNFFKGYTVGANVAYNELKENNLPADFLSYWATPKYRFNASFANNNVYKNWGFNITLRSQSAFFYESDFALGDVPAFTTIDAQISRRLPAIHSIIKIGGSNITNHYYQNGFANPQIGGLYYVSFGYNIF